MNIGKELQVRWTKWTERPINYLNPWAHLASERLGSGYGGWVIPQNFLHGGSVCYLVGAGTDVSFDLAVASKYGAEVFIIDPTPRAVAHFEELKKQVLAGGRMPFAASKTGFYDAKPSDFDKMTFLPVGLWSEEKTVRFFSPTDPTHVSHSIVNLHGTATYFDAAVKRLGSLMRENGHDRLDLLKIDIEGAEYEVIKTIVEDNIPVGVVCIEFDESARHNLGTGYIGRIEAAINSLERAGFSVFEKEKGNYNFSLVHQSVLERLKSA